MSEAEKLAAFLLTLQTSPTQRENFKKHPKREMLRFNLEPKTIDAVLHEKTKVIWRILTVSPSQPPAHVGHAVGVEKMARRRRRKRR